MLTSTKSKITRSINGCKNNSTVKREINRAHIRGEKVELLDCAGKDCICRIDILRDRLYQLQRDYKKASETDRQFISSQISTVQIELVKYGTH
jgi:hypothetical protein